MDDKKRIEQEIAVSADMLNACKKRAYSQREIRGLIHDLNEKIKELENLNDIIDSGIDFWNDEVQKRKFFGHIRAKRNLLDFNDMSDDMYGLLKAYRMYVEELSTHCN